MVWQAIGALGSAALGTLFNRKSQQIAAGLNLNDSKSLAKYSYDLDKKAYDYQRKGQMSDALKLMKEENQYNTTFMSNSAKATQSLNQNLMDYQYGLERESRQNSFQDTRKDLTAAGYNPLLAVGNQSNYTPVSSGVSATSAGVEAADVGSKHAQIAGVASDIMNSAIQTKSAVNRNAVMNKNDTEKAIADVKEQAAKTMNLNSATAYQNIRNSIENMTGMDRALAEIDEIGSRAGLNRAQVNKVKSEIRLNGMQELLIQSEIGVKNAQAGLINSENTAMTANVNYGKWSKSHPVLSGFMASPAVAQGKEFISGIGDIVPSKQGVKVVSKAGRAAGKLLKKGR